MKNIKSLSEFVEWVRTAQDGDVVGYEGDIAECSNGRVWVTTKQCEPRTAQVTSIERLTDEVVKLREAIERQTKKDGGE